MAGHTVEKIGGSTMSRYDVVLDNVIIGKRKPHELYNRIFVVSAYGGITDLMLEHKKTGAPGVYSLYAENDDEWESALTNVARRMYEINSGFSGMELELDLEDADAFVKERVEGVRVCLRDLRRVCSYGHVQMEEQLPAVREMISALGEAHSAYNSVLILKKRGVNAVLVDLTGWKDTENHPFEEVIRRAFAQIDLSKQLPIVTGYTKCEEGIMHTYDRGYSEITFSKIATVTGASEGVIHKEFHLSSGDPKLVGVDKVRPIGKTNFDVADQLADLGMEAIHPRASKGMENAEPPIPIRVKNAFDPDHPGTLICGNDYKSPKPRVEMVTGHKDIMAIEVWDPDMVRQSGYDYRLLGYLEKYRISYIAKNTNANTITHYVAASSHGLEDCVSEIRDAFPTASVRTVEVAIVSAIGSNMKFPGFLAMATKALADGDINILAVDQCMRQVNMQFIVHQNDFDGAIRALHRSVVEGVDA